MNKHELNHWALWKTAATTAAIDQNLQNIYCSLADEIAQHKPHCQQSGNCCHFETAGHLLYATGLEITWLIQQLDETGQQQLAAATLPAMNGCPFQVDNLCSVHPLRPLGCRIYFCDPNAQTWQNEIYEKYLQQLRDLHEQFNIPYQYMEWRAGLKFARDS